MARVQKFAYSSPSQHPFTGARRNVGEKILCAAGVVLALAVTTSWFRGFLVSAVLCRVLQTMKRAWSPREAGFDRRASDRLSVVLRRKCP